MSVNYGNFIQYLQNSADCFIVTVFNNSWGPRRFDLEELSPAHSITYRLTNLLPKSDVIIK